MFSFFKNLLNKSNAENEKIDYLQDKSSKRLDSYDINEQKKEEWIEPIYHHLQYIKCLEKESKKFHQEKNYDDEVITLQKCAEYCLKNKLISEKIYKTESYSNMIYHAKLYCDRKINMIKKEQDAINLRPQGYEEDDFSFYNKNNFQELKLVNSSNLTPPSITNNFVLDIVESYFDKIYEQEFKKEIKPQFLDKYIISQENNNEINNSKRKRKLYSFVVNNTKNDIIINILSPLINKNTITNEQQIIEAIKGYDLELKKFKENQKNKLAEINEQNTHDTNYNKQKNRLHNYLLSESSELNVNEVLTPMINNGYITNKQQIRGILRLVRTKHNERLRIYQNQKKKNEFQLNNNYNNKNNFQKSKRKSIPNRVRHQVFQRDGYRCRECGARLEDGATLEIDHIVPVSKGGTNDISNLQTLCKDCNRGKYTDTWIGGKI